MQRATTHFHDVESGELMDDRGDSIVSCAKIAEQVRIHKTTREENDLKQSVIEKKVDVDTHIQ